MNKCKYRCKYCNERLEFTNDLLYVCPECGLLYTLEFVLQEYQSGMPIGYCNLIALEGGNITKYSPQNGNNILKSKFYRGGEISISFYYAEN